MRKTYQKPVLYAESYELVEHVAGPCNYMDAETSAIHVSHRDKDRCFFSFVDDPDVQMFVDSNSVCTSPVGEEVYHSSETCYNGLFSSTGKIITYFAS